jgi:hypothetical protein
MTPRQDVPEIPREVLQDNLIETQRDNDELRAELAKAKDSIKTALDLLKVEQEYRGRLETWITEASSAFNLDGSKDTLEDAVGLVRMCHEGRAAIARVAELEAALKMVKEYNPLNYAWSYDPNAYQKVLDIVTAALEPKP